MHSSRPLLYGVFSDLEDPVDSVEDLPVLVPFYTGYSLITKQKLYKRIWWSSRPLLYGVFSDLMTLMNWLIEIQKFSSPFIRGILWFSDNIDNEIANKVLVPFYTGYSLIGDSYLKFASEIQFSSPFIRGILWFRYNKWTC